MKVMVFRGESTGYYSGAEAQGELVVPLRICDMLGIDKGLFNGLEACELDGKHSSVPVDMSEEIMELDDYLDTLLNEDLSNELLDSLMDCIDDLKYNRYAMCEADEDNYIDPLKYLNLITKLNKEIDYKKSLLKKSINEELIISKNTSIEGVELYPGDKIVIVRKKDKIKLSSEFYGEARKLCLIQ